MAGSTGFRADIEGLRAIAIIPVLLYHAHSGLAPGGYVGVDIFFVISGYLIAGMVLGGFADGSFSLADFYRRRIRRIFPALFAMLAGVTALAPFVLSPPALQKYAGSLVAMALFLSNFRFWTQTSYFQVSAGAEPLLHTWSLSVEAQFYLVFPLLLLAIRRWAGGRYGHVLLALAAASFALNLHLVPLRMTTAFFLLPPRAFELLIGALLATGIVPPLATPLLRQVTAAFGVAAIAVAVALFNDHLIFPGYFALLPCLGAAALIHAGSSGTNTCSQLLASPPLRFIGTISYALYLWHWPLLSLLDAASLGRPSPAAIAAVLAASCVLAVLSLNLVERPFRAAGRQHHPVFVKSAILVAGTAAIGVAGVLDHGLPWRYPPAAQRLFTAEHDHSETRQVCMNTRLAILPYDQRCVFGAGAALGRIAVWGDSHGVELAEELGHSAGDRATVVELTAVSCPPSLGYRLPVRPQCVGQNEATAAALAADQRVRYVVLTAYFQLYAASPAFWAGLDRAVARLQTAGKTVILVYPYVNFPAQLPEILGQVWGHGYAPERYGVAVTAFRRDAAAQFSALDALVARRGVVAIPTDDLLCPDGICAGYADGQVLYFDDNHLSRAGAALVARRVAAQIEALDRDIARPAPATRP